MVKLFLSVWILCSATFSYARSLHPCTPTVQAKPSIMHCKDGEKRYSIVIETLMSPPLEICQGSNRVEYHTANVKFSVNGVAQAQFTLDHESFRYSLVHGTFVSPKYSLNLKNCVSPMHGGGFSVGN